MSTETREANFFVGTSFGVNEIALSAAEIQRWSDSLTLGHKAESTMQMKLAAEQLSRAARQAEVLADSVARAATNQLNRRHRV